MSKKEKVTIKFWNKYCGREVLVPAAWILDRDLDCYEWNAKKEQYEWGMNVEPHFYIGDKRVG